MLASSKSCGFLLEQSVVTLPAQMGPTWSLLAASGDFDRKEEMLLSGASTAPSSRRSHWFTLGDENPRGVIVEL